jgi:hypothetical protein
MMAVNKNRRNSANLGRGLTAIAVTSGGATPDGFKKKNRRTGPNDPDEWTQQQCGGCRFFITMTGGFRSDWGVCTNMASPRDGLATFEHDGCDAFVADENGW